LAIIGWATGNVTKIDATVVALVFFSLCAIFKLISWDNVLNNKGAWSTLIWYGAIIGLANILAQAKFFDWLAKLTAAHVQLTGYSAYVVLFALLIISLAVRYIFASMGAYVGAFIPVLFTIGLVAQAPLMPLALLMGASSAFGCLLTHYGGAVGPVLFGTGFVDQKTWWTVGAVLALFNVAVYMVVGLPFWKLLGIW
jgi:DASS family divalent anion:Na+ symporter